MPYLYVWLAVASYITVEGGCPQVGDSQVGRVRWDEIRYVRRTFCNKRIHYRPELNLILKSMIARPELYNIVQRFQLMMGLSCPQILDIHYSGFII